MGHEIQTAFRPSALYVFVFYVIYWNTPIVLGLSGRALTSDLVMECLEHLDIDCAVIPPSVLEDMSQSQKHISALRRLKLVSWGGGPLAQEAGDTLVQNGVVINNTLNSTEFAPFPVYYQPRLELWQYFIVNPDLLGAEWREVDGSFELVVTRKEKHPGLQGFFYTFPYVNEFSTGDLFKPHPTIPHHWIHHGRSDTVIVFSNGEKLNPVTIEDAVRRHPAVNDALVVGSNRLQPALLLEPLTPRNLGKDTQDLIENVWHLVDGVNQHTVRHGRIERSHIAISKPNKPFQRSGKGTIQRTETLKVYEMEIDQLYKDAERHYLGRADQLDLSSEESLIASFRRIVEACTNGLKIDPEKDFFQSGIDSLQVINMSRRIRAGLSASGFTIGSNQLGPRVIYANPTLRNLAQLVLQMTRSSSREGHLIDQPDDEDNQEVEAMQKLHARYSQNVTKAKPGRPPSLAQNQTVLLTGSTGMLGSYLLDSLAWSPTVKKVVCLNRAQDGGARQQADSMQSRGLSEVYNTKAAFFHADLAEANLGLPLDIYEDLQQEVDCIIHSAWPVNLNLHVNAFEPQIQGVRRIADFSATAKKRMRVIFISSVSTADRWNTERNGPVPETQLQDWHLPSNGYGRSKMVASLILDDAAIAGDFLSATVRVGQVAGSENENSTAEWNRREWFPNLISSSLYLSALPKHLGRLDRVDWMPAERIAQILVDIAGVSGNTSTATDFSNGYFHGVNPATTTWAHLVPAVHQFYSDRIRELISFEDWLERLEQSATEGDDTNTGLRLLDTYRAAASTGMDAAPVIFDMSRTTTISPTMKNSQPISKEMLLRWCAQWNFS
ncbi:uncharacterized protein JN550_012587 [Neoarthrinium moseri]|uniref:uncharacterized protein n=1 Tax=Neoarthrinium moseri TaxID=1658444 RepID=UPI001FDBA5A9|nr:uncharacterized protein JN550_012587 [Neoarthrinium moseri]KAI1858540.1 hypothetical protein JN550_012587 [Neoarthrinium moseri]